MPSEIVTEHLAPSQPCCDRQRQQGGADGFKREVVAGHKLWRQMLAGFICAACLGLVMLILGSVFIGNAIRGNTSSTIMLCVMGMVCGLIILVGTAILGRLFISRKWRVTEGRQPIHHPEACFHTCSIIYTPSQDQLNGPPFPDPPPAYEMVVFPEYNADAAGSVEVTDGLLHTHHPVLVTPPKYSVAAAPLPAYGEQV